MRILIVSDTHRRNENFLRVVDKIGPLDLVVHCGDVEGSEYVISEAAGCPVEIVQGNNDFFSDLPKEKEFMIGGYKVWLTHGHHYYISMNNEMIKQEARAREADIIVYSSTASYTPGLEGVISEFPQLTECKAYENNRVYQYADAFWNSIDQTDILACDFAEILYPDVFEGRELTYYIKLDK